MGMRLLLAEDELSLSRALVKILEKNGYSVDAVANGQDALDYLKTGLYDGLILDIMMPVMDGIAVLKKLRESGNGIPVLMLTAKSEVEDKVAGLNLGANDYLTKPFYTKELLARIRAMLRVTSKAADSQIHMGNITLDCACFELSSNTGSFRLANKEFQVMEILMMNQGRLISTERFLEKIWGYNSDAENHVVWVYISCLRKKLSALQANICIKAVRNSGYSLEACP